MHRIYKGEDLSKIAQQEQVNQVEQYSVRWVNQWLETQSSTENPLNFSFENNPEDYTQFQAKPYTISWRFVTNGGQDDDIIRPVIGVFGLPFYPGSSMKGAFSKACTQEQKQRYQLTKNGDEPSLLRFHGGYPINDWTKQLVDIVHPQQKWQLQEMDTTKKPKNESAFTLISLYQPTIKFGISSLLPDTNWKEIWEIWEKALGYGIGCRVSTGYGLTNETIGDVLYQVKLHGIGGASKLLNRQAEFRPNIFRAALRGYGLRIFSGLNSALAEDIVDELFGGIRSGQEKVGLLGMAFHPDNSEWRSADENEAYDVTGNLIWQLSGKLDNPEHRPYLTNLVEKLTQFAMLLGGFGKSWRRADHRLFYPKYKKHLIGCHWSWVDDKHNSIRNLDHPIDDANKVIEATIQAAKEWMQKRGFQVKVTIPNQSSTPIATPNQENRQNPQLKKPVPRPVKQQNQTTKELEWREKWHHNNVQVWGRIAENAEDSQIIPLLHSAQQSRNQQPQNKHRGNYHQPNTTQNQSISKALQKAPKPNNQILPPSIYRTCLTGCVKDPNKSDDPTRIGRLWHRMYPLIDGKYLELVTIFPTGCPEAESFINWLASFKNKQHQHEWKQVW
ncbi:MAG: RAMP superfamily protein [Gloeotrichia echinulata GP01]